MNFSDNTASDTSIYFPESRSRWPWAIEQSLLSNPGSHSLDFGVLLKEVLNMSCAVALVPHH